MVCRREGIKILLPTAFAFCDGKIRLCKWKGAGRSSLWDPELGEGLGVMAERGATKEKVKDCVTTFFAATTAAINANTRLRYKNIGLETERAEVRQIVYRMKYH